MRRLASLLVAAAAVPLLALPSTAQSDKQTPPPSDVSRQDGSLSEKLNSTSGVIHPEGSVDPGMQKTPSATGAMPVVPPPGSPGGNSDVVPK